MASAPQSGAPPPPPGLWALVALGFVPAGVLLFLEADFLGRVLGLIFIAGIGIHCFRLRRRGARPPLPR